MMLRYLLAAIVWCLLGCGGTIDTPSSSTSIVIPEPVVTESYLRSIYVLDNERYFRNSLPGNPTIDMKEKKDMASTWCREDGSCTLSFNPKYTAAFRVADFTMLHEQCHIKTWSKDINPETGKEVVHGKVWRTCMLQLDAAGAFREIIIDNYNEGL